jgi:hypothetical protein
MNRDAMTLEDSQDSDVRNAAREASTEGQADSRQRSPRRFRSSEAHPGGHRTE